LATALSVRKKLAVEVQREGRAEVVVLRLVLLRPDVLLVRPPVEPGERLDRGGRVDLHAQVPHPAEAGRDVERDVVVAAPAREPRPRPVRVLHLREFLELALGLGVEPVGIE